MLQTDTDPLTSDQKNALGYAYIRASESDTENCVVTTRFLIIQMSSAVILRNDRMGKSLVELARVTLRQAIADMNNPETKNLAFDKCTSILVLLGPHLYKNKYMKIDSKSFAPNMAPKTTPTETK